MGGPTFPQPGRQGGCTSQGPERASTQPWMSQSPRTKAPRLADDTVTQIHGHHGEGDPVSDATWHVTVDTLPFSLWASIPSADTGSL